MAPLPGAVQAGLRSGEGFEPGIGDLAPAVQAAAVGRGPEPGRRAVECRDLLPGAGQQAEDLGAFEADRHAFGVVLVVVRGEGLLLGECLDLGGQG